MLSQLGITVPTGTNMQLKNVAAVMVTASLPPFGRQGQTIDVVVSSMGNAKSLRGGTLLMTPLKGVDSQVYACLLYTSTHSHCPTDGNYCSSKAMADRTAVADWVLYE